MDYQRIRLWSPMVTTSGKAAEPPCSRNDHTPDLQILMQTPAYPDHGAEKQCGHRESSNLLFVKRSRAIEVQWHQAARRSLVWWQKARILENQSESDLSILIPEKTGVVGDVEKFSEMMVLRQFGQAIFRPDFFHQLSQLRRIRVPEVTLELLRHVKCFW